MTERINVAKFNSLQLFRKDTDKATVARTKRTIEYVGDATMCATERNQTKGIACFCSLGKSSVSSTMISNRYIPSWR